MNPTILISPLLALMRNQIAAAERMGVHARTINSENQEEWREVEAALAQNLKVDILLISPERLANEHFRAEVLGPVAGRVPLLVVDEAHCISDWGHDFRPHYRFIERIVRTLPPNVRVLATTATANNQVLADLQTVLGPNLTVSRGNLHRPSLLLQTMRMPSQPERMAWLATHLPSIAGQRHRLHADRARCRPSRWLAASTGHPGGILQRRDGRTARGTGECLAGKSGESPGGDHGVGHGF